MNETHISPYAAWLYCTLWTKKKLCGKFHVASLLIKYTKEQRRDPIFVVVNTISLKNDGLVGLVLRQLDAMS